MSASAGSPPKSVAREALLGLRMEGVPAFGVIAVVFVVKPGGDVDVVEATASEDLPPGLDPRMVRSLRLLTAELRGDIKRRVGMFGERSGLEIEP